MSPRPEIVITGVGVVSPLGIGTDAFWACLRAGRSGIGPITLAKLDGIGVHLFGEVRDFDGKLYVQPRKSLKVMSRSMQFGVTAGQFAWKQAGLAEGAVDPDRIGVVFGADNICAPLDEAAPSYVGTVKDGVCDMAAWQVRAREIAYPLGMLKTLPNLVACHVSISLDARGPNNTHHQNEVSSLMAVAEAMRVIERGAADVVVAGGASSLTDPFDWARSLVMDELSPAREVGSAPRPFDADRDGQVRGEGAAALVLESRRHAEARGAKILARLLGYGAACDVHLGRGANPAIGLVRAMDLALGDSGLSPGDIGHLSAHGLGTVVGDRLEASAIGQVFNGVPVTAPKSFVGNLGAACGAMEIAASVLALVNNQVPMVLNHRRPDPSCPLKVIAREPLIGARPMAMVLNQTNVGQAAAVVLAGA
jgi:3-oxoacyl-[acyl-carrier-protein] synthase II